MQGNAAVSGVSGDHGELLSCAVLGTTSECEGVDDCPISNGAHRYRARLRHKVGREVADSVFGSAPEKWVPIAVPLTT